MAITVNVISENNAFNVENANYCTVALPITACWGPGFTLPTSEATSNTSGDVDPVEEALEGTAWSLFNAGPDGVESFIATYRGPSSNYRSAKDYSYYMALSLLNAGYAVQTCRLCPGTNAATTVPSNGGSSSTDTSDTPFVGLSITAKYPGSFGNNLGFTIKQKVTTTSKYWNFIGYAIDATGSAKAVENLVFVFDLDQSTDTLLPIDELQSKFFNFKVVGNFSTEDPEAPDYVDMTVNTLQKLEGGSDVADASSQTAIEIAKDAYEFALKRYTNSLAGTGCQYIGILSKFADGTAEISKSAAEAIRFNEWVYTWTTGDKSASFGTTNGVLDLLKDKINYNPNRLITPWDDQDILALDPDVDVLPMEPSPLTEELMEVASVSRCATAYIDVPRSLPRNLVWNDDPSDNGIHLGYAQRLSSVPATATDALYASSDALFAPWGQYVYAGTSRQAPATPSFLALLIDRGMIKNQAVQYEWALPTSRSNNVKIGQLAYTVPKTLLDKWQAPDGTRVNTITNVPSLGTTIWGNATLFDVPVATYQALMNLSTRKLINAVQDTVYKIGIGLEFQYNGQEAYAKFFAGVTPLLDTMRNVGAILDYKVKMAADINNLDSINANSVVGTIYLVIAGVIENITVDLIALPQGTDLSQY